jgi:glycosyltransferase involved in cell wall biosynthesis
MSETLRAETADLVTVVLPAFNALSSNPEYLALAIESVIAQTRRNLELIIVDDGSADDYTALRGRFTDQRITCLRQDNAVQSAVAAGNCERLALARRRLDSVCPHLRLHLCAGLAIFPVMPMVLFAVWQNAALNSRLYRRVMWMLGRR